MTTTTQPAELPALSDEREAFDLIHTLMAHMNEAHLAKSEGWKQANFAAADQTESKLKDWIRAALAANGAQAQDDQAPAGGGELAAVTEMAYLLRLVPRGDIVPVQILGVVRKQYRAALAAQAAPAVPEGFAAELAEFIEYEARDFAAERFEDCAVESGFIDGLKHAAAMLAAAPTPAAQAPDPAAVDAPPDDWAVYNSGACVADGISYAEALDYLTPERLARDWTAVCVVTKDNISKPPVQDAAPQPTKEQQG